MLGVHNATLPSDSTMRSKPTLTFVALLFALSVSAFAAKASQASSKIEALMKKSDCLSCHSVAAQLVGPSFREVALKYKGDKGALAALVQNVKAGSAGTWGEAAMNAHPGLKDEQIKAMVKWVLAQK